MTEQVTHDIPAWTRADRLRKAREHAGMQQQELADRIGISRNSVGNYEAGRTAPRRIVLNAWALATGVPMSWLETGAGAVNRCSLPSRSVSITPQVSGLLASAL
jgi:transcriptional regulator with XRE-family HTH domain